MDTIWRPQLTDGAGPKYTRVADAIRSGIAQGVLEVGGKLPPVRDLAWRLGITPGTVARAYSILTNEGVLRAEVGRGTFVAPARTTHVSENPIEIDSIVHNSESEDFTHQVNLFSPHLPAVGQDKLIRRLLAQIAERPPSGMMHYPSRAAFKPAREAVVRWLDNAPIGSFGECDVVLAHGGQSAILLVLQAVLRGRRPVIVAEELSYPGFRRAAELLRAEVVPVEMDEHGVVPEALERVARMHDAQVFCTSPEVHNPTCGFTPEERRLQLAQVAQRLDFQILEDDCYRMGRAQASSYRMLAPERGWYVCSISKTITPSLRLGFAVAPKGKAAALRRAAEHGFFGLATPLGDLCAQLLAHPDIPGYTDKVREVTSAYIKVAVNVLGSYDLTWRRDVPFLWLMLPQGWRAGAFCQAAEEQGVRLRSADEFACRDARTPHAVRLAVNAGVSLKSFEAAMLRLRDLLDNPPEQIGV
ncbi:MAG: PLP-dependent aminotransferase family protein [Pseudomonadota bacterium]